MSQVSHPYAAVQLITISPLFQINRAAKSFLMRSLLGNLSFGRSDEWVNSKPWDCCSIVGDVSLEGAVEEKVIVLASPNPRSEKVSLRY